MAYLREYSSYDLGLTERLARNEARQSFWAYRQLMQPKFKLAWWQRRCAYEFMTFRDDMKAGKRPVLLVMAPPQHGKSKLTVDFASWLMGDDPDLRVIYASFSTSLGARANREMQRLMDNERYAGVFPNTRLPRIGALEARNSGVIQIAGREGQFLNTTVQGKVTGEGMDLGILDDPIKGRAEANSPTIRNRVWEWLNDDFFTRLSENAGVLGIMTRWHVDDPFGRLIERDKRVKVLRFPAIAVANEEYRSIGEPLMPEHKSLGFLMERKVTMSTSSWEALYQQSPTIIGGELFKENWWNYYQHPAPQTQWRAIYVDTAQKTKEQNDYSVFQCWGRAADGKIIMLDQIRGKWEAPDLLKQAIMFWRKHRAVPNMGALRAMKIEDKVSGTGLIQSLRRGDQRIPVVALPRSTDKVTRALDVLPVIENGYVWLPEQATWMTDFLTELSHFPGGAHDDQVDPLMDAIADMGNLTGSTYTLEGVR